MPKFSLPPFSCCKSKTIRYPLCFHVKRHYLYRTACLILRLFHLLAFTADLPLFPASRQILQSVNFLPLLLQTIGTAIVRRLSAKFHCVSTVLFNIHLLPDVFSYNSLFNYTTCYYLHRTFYQDSFRYLAFTAERGLYEGGERGCAQGVFQLRKGPRGREREGRGYLLSRGERD